MLISSVDFAWHGPYGVRWGVVDLVPTFTSFVSLSYLKLLFIVRNYRNAIY